MLAKKEMTGGLPVDEKKKKKILYHRQPVSSHNPDLSRSNMEPKPESHLSSKGNVRPLHLGKMHEEQMLSNTVYQSGVISNFSDQQQQNSYVEIRPSSGRREGHKSITNNDSKYNATFGVGSGSQMSMKQPGMRKEEKTANKFSENFDPNNEDTISSLKTQKKNSSYIEVGSTNGGSTHGGIAHGKQTSFSSYGAGTTSIIVDNSRYGKHPAGKKKLPGKENIDLPPAQNYLKQERTLTNDISTVKRKQEVRGILNST
jgi:hypothetical protein